MAAQLSAGQLFKFRQIKIIKDECLGTGSYGAVYKAKCDKLPCAAKLLHPILFHTRDPGSQRIRERFKQECHILSGIRHPHIVQYLGTCTETDSGLPVLLMELMDESLTHLLERSRQPLPFHQEVNICHDTALALDYLHSNDIIHRDLSSNNVLVTGSRAKVTDFGMSKALEANPGLTPFTHCPGTAVYMPPEGLRNPPVYTTKLDCFSFGVLGIQIMTRQFPKPGPEQRVVEDARSPVGTLQIPIPDSERRKSHIYLIAPDHPLLLLALRCLSYRDSDRPTAEELCDQLETLKQGTKYRDSQTQSQVQQATQVHQSENPRQDQIASGTPVDTFQLQWKTGPKAPAGVVRGSSAVSSDGTIVYFACDKSVYEYNTRGSKWSSLPQCPYIAAGLVVVEGLLTTVGGRSSLTPMNDLFSLTCEKRKQQWTKHYPPMPTKRWSPAVLQP